MLPHRRGLGRDAQAATSAEKKREMAAMGISPSSNTDEPYTRERGLASAAFDVPTPRAKAFHQYSQQQPVTNAFYGRGPPVFETHKVAYGWPDKELRFV